VIIGNCVPKDKFSEEDECFYRKDVVLVEYCSVYGGALLLN
jgi:hypothetical protein